MIIDLATPFWGSIVSGIILMIILGLFHYIKMSIAQQAMKDNISNLLSELASLQKRNNDEITRIKQTGSEIIVNNFKEYQKQVKELIQKYHRLVPPARWALLESLYDKEHEDS